MNQMSQWIFQFEQDSLFHSVNQLIQWIKIIEGTINFIYPSVGEFTRSSSSQVERVRNNYLTRFTSFSFNESVESVNLSVITESHLFLIQWISWVSDSFVWLLWPRFTPLSFRKPKESVNLSITTEKPSSQSQWIGWFSESFSYNWETLFPQLTNQLSDFTQIKFLLQIQMSQNYSKLDSILIFIFLVSVLYWDRPLVMNIPKANAETSLIFDSCKSDSRNLRIH